MRKEIQPDRESKEKRPRPSIKKGDLTRIGIMNRIFWLQLTIFFKNKIILEFRREAAGRVAKIFNDLFVEDTEIALMQTRV